MQHIAHYLTTLLARNTLLRFEHHVSQFRDFCAKVYKFNCHALPFKNKKARGEPQAKTPNWFMSWVEGVSLYR